MGTENLMTTLLMSGASRGIGRRAAEVMLRDDPDLRLIVIARQGTPIAHERVTTVHGDLASLDSVRQIAAAVTGPLDGYVGNAGLQMGSASTTTPDGFETTFAVNVLAHHLLIRLLWDQFRRPGRIVITGSDSHFGTPLTTMGGLVPAPVWQSADRLVSVGAERRANTGSAGRRAYSTSKLGVLYLVHALARRLPEGVDVYTFNPGLTPGTGLVRDGGVVGRALWSGVFPLLNLTPLGQSVDAVGDQLAAAAIGPRPGPSGSYIDRWKVIPSSAESYDERREEELWAAAERLTGQALT